MSNDVIMCTVSMGKGTKPLKRQIAMGVFKNEAGTPRIEIQTKALQEMRTSDAATRV